MDITRDAINKKYIEILEGDGINAAHALSVNQRITILKAIVDLNGLALPKASSPESLQAMTRQQLLEFVKEHESRIIDITPETDPTPGGGADAKSEKTFMTPRQNFKKSELSWLKDIGDEYVKKPLEDLE